MPLAISQRLTGLGWSWPTGALYAIKKRTKKRTSICHENNKGMKIFLICWLLLTWTLLSGVMRRMRWSSRMCSDPSSGEMASSVGQRKWSWSMLMVPLQGTGAQWERWSWPPISVRITPDGSTTRILVPSAMYMLPSAEIAKPEEWKTIKMKWAWLKWDEEKEL